MMVKSYSNMQPRHIEYMPLPDGLADIRLHTNIRLVEDADGNEIWEADENYFRADMTEEYVTQHFDELLDYEPPVPKPEPTEAEQIANLESKVEMLTDCILEMSELLYV